MEYTIMDANLLNGLSLAYIGDAIYEVYIREYILSLGYSNVNRLHKKACEFTSGVSQSKFIRYFLDNNILTEEEQSIYKRGRNSHNHSVRKNIDIQSYMEATGFEAVIGYLYINKNPERIKELINICIEINKEVANG